MNQSDFETPGQTIPCPNHLVRSCLLKGLWRLKCFVLTAVLLFSSPACSEADPELVRIGTGGRAGVYYPLGKLIAQAITGVSGEQTGYIGVAQISGGSVANMQALAAGEIQVALVQADVASWAYQGSHMFTADSSVRGVRAIASLYPESLQIVSRKDAGIRTVAQMKGKRISIDEIGSGTLSAMRIVLEAHGLSEKDFSAVYLKPEFTFEKLRNGQLDGFAVMAGVPMEGVSRIADLALHIVPVAPEQAERIHQAYPYLFSGEIPDGTYPGVPATPTLQVHALLVVMDKMEDEKVRRITQILWNDRTQVLLRSGHPQAAAISLQTALAGVSIPLHPGAQAYYRERGIPIEKVAP
jgi:uncharacterized protein